MFSHFVPISFDGFPGGAIGPARALRACDGNGQRGRGEGTNHFGEAPEGGGNLAGRGFRMKTQGFLGERYTNQYTHYNRDSKRQNMGIYTY